MIKYYDNILDGSIDEIKILLKDAISKHTWKEIEATGVPFTFNGKRLSIVSGAKWGRVAMHSNILTMADNEKILWRFKDREWSYVTKDDLFLMHTVVNRHLSENAKWEYGLHQEIDSARTIDELQSIADKGFWNNTISYTIQDDKLTVNTHG